MMKCRLRKFFRSHCNAVILALLSLLAFMPASAQVIGLPIVGSESAERVTPLHPTRSKESGPQESRSVVVEGRASLNAGQDVARRQALLDAYRRAVGAGGSIEIGEFSQLRNFRDVVDIVTKRTHGFITHYEILAEGRATDRSNTYFVAIRAEVVDRLETRDDDVLAQMVAMIGSPKVLFMLAAYDESPSAGGTEQASSHRESVDLQLRQGDVEVSLRRDAQQRGDAAVAVPGSAGRGSAQTVEHELARRFRDVGYRVLTSDDVRAGFALSAEVLQRARQGMGADAAEVGRLAGADVVVAGTIRYRVSATSGGGTDLEPILGTVSLNAKAIIPSSGRVLGVATIRERYMAVRHADPLLAREESSARAARNAADALKWEIPQVLADEPRLIRIRINGIAYAEADSMRRFFAGLPGIEGVRMLGWKDESSEFDILSIFTGPREGELFRAMQEHYPNIRMVRMESYDLTVAFK